MIALLAHLESVGYPWSPRRVGEGFDSAGNEVLTFVEGVSPQPHPWSDEAVHQVGEMVRQLHDAASAFSPPDGSVWMDWWGRSLGDSNRGFGHGDLGPWNVMAVDGIPTGFIDWDTSGPYDPTWEVAQAAWLNAQLHDDDLAERLGLGTAVERARQLALFLDGYQLPRRDRGGLVDRMVEFAVHSARADAVEYGVEPETVETTGADGFPFLWGITWRTRSASWMLRNRRSLERSIRETQS
ncbi:MAG: phosphotransferase [Actinomycetota bacterium]